MAQLACCERAAHRIERARRRRRALAGRRPRFAQREWVRFVRQRNRVFGAIGQPIMFWLLFGAGLGPSFRLAGRRGARLSYREYFFPGSLVLILLFTAIFTTISIIEDRREGFLQSVLVAPIPRWTMVLGKVIGGTLVALVEGLLFLGAGADARHSISRCRRVAADRVARWPLSLGADVAGVRDRLADGLDARLSRHHERVSDADVAVERRVLSAAAARGRHGWARGGCRS